MSNAYELTFTAGPEHIDANGHVNNTVWVRWMENLGLDLYRFCAGQVSHYATLASNASGLMPPRYERRRRVL